MEYILTVIIAVLFAYIVYTDSQRTKERRELLDRIMANNLDEYQLHQNLSSPPPKGRSKMSQQRKHQETPEEAYGQYLK